MARGRKPSVDYTKRHEWLERYRHGTTPPSIATSDGYDVRTVRKSLDLARQELEAGDARTTVYRDALEKHYADLCSLAEQMDAVVAAEQRVDASLNERMWSALRQHIPASMLWRSVDRWNKQLDERDALNRTLKERVRSLVRGDGQLAPLADSASPVALADGMTKALLFQVTNKRLGLPGLDPKNELRLETIAGGGPVGYYGTFGLGQLNREDLEVVRETVTRLETAIAACDELKAVKKAEEDIAVLKQELQDHLAVITLRRIVPGSCRYCPV